MCPEDSELKDDLINQVISIGGVCRTAPATPGLLNSTLMEVMSIIWHNEEIEKAKESSKRYCKE